MWPSLFVDSWKVVDNNEYVDITNFVQIHDVENALELHKKLDLTNKPDTCIFINEESDISGYIRAVKLEFPIWNIYVIHSTDNNIKAIPKCKDFEFFYSENEWYTRRLIQYEQFNLLNDKENYGNDGYYIISGGLGYVGKHVAHMFFEKGVSENNIILISSSQSTLPNNWEYPFRPVVKKCDISNEDEVHKLLNSYDHINVIFHAAGILSDKTLLNLTEEDFEKVYKVKVNGAYIIDNFIQGLVYKPNVVLCSSIASGFGAIGQANYSAGNAALDKLARTRDNYLSIRWGAWVGGGMARDETLERAERMGIMGLKYNDAIRILHLLLSNQSKLNEHVITLCPLNYEKLISSSGYLDLISENKQAPVEDMCKKLKTMKDRPSQVKFVTGLVLKNCESLGMEIDIDDLEIPWREQGFDSLSMVEMVNILRSQFNGITFSDTFLFDYPNISKTIEYVVDNVSNLRTIKKNRKQWKKWDPIAIVGTSCRFPGNMDCTLKFHDFLMKGGDGMVEIPKERFDVREYPEIYVDKAGIVDDFFYFDNKYFNISEAEAEMMDPQQRLSLECTDELMQQLVDKNKYKNETGVYVGCTSSEFGTINRDNVNSSYFATGSSNAIIANRVSYSFGFQGPSMTIDTACSSSLVALDAACMAIHNESCVQAVVLGVNTNFLPQGFVATCAAKMLSPNGRCATFSDKADGYARAEGCGGILIKKLSAAVADGDRVLGVIHSTAVNQDGRSANLTSPNGPSQERVIEEALGRAKLNVDDIDFIETHGTGTSLGDPQEVESISNVFSDRIDKLPLGAVKSNIGHLEGAAGMAGMIKTIEALSHGVLPPNIHCTSPNPRIEPFLEKNIILPTQGPIKLNPKKTSYYAGVSSFGFGGTNAHCIIGFHRPHEETETKTK